jgi:hypothetical protein
MPRVSIALTVVHLRVLLCAVGVLSFVLPRSARAESPNQKAVPIYVLSILTDDADDQADALTQALRARVRQAPGLSLLETPQSLETLTIALRCPPRPDAPCLQRIGDQLHADHYVWASLAKRKGGEVSVDAHFWSRGKGQVDAAETFSDNLKDPSDDALRAVASKLIAELTNAGSGGSSAAAGGGGGERPTGTLVVHAGSGGGSVLVDGAEKGTLDGGTARVEVGEGQHTVTVHVPGSQAPSLTTTVKAGGEQEVSFALAPGHDDESEDTGPSKPFPTRKVVAYSSLGVAVVLITVAAIEGLGWKSDKDDSDTQRANIPSNVGDACSVAGTTPSATYAAAAAAACNDSNDAKTKSTISWVTGVAGLAAGGVGVWLLTTDHESDAATSTTRTRPSVGLAPLVGPHEGGLRLNVRF